MVEEVLCLIAQVTLELAFIDPACRHVSDANN